CSPLPSCTSRLTGWRKASAMGPPSKLLPPQMLRPTRIFVRSHARQLAPLSLKYMSLEICESVLGLARTSPASIARSAYFAGWDDTRQKGEEDRQAKKSLLHAKRGMPLARQ